MSVLLRFRANCGIGLSGVDLRIAVEDQSALRANTSHHFVETRSKGLAHALGFHVQA